jgi:type VI secretion system protein ImpJ
MNSASELLDAIQWHEGLLLAPQHFQQLAKRQEQLLAYHLLIGQPFHWGVRTLEFDRALLIKERLRIVQLEAVMRDGLVVWHSADRSNAAPVELDLSPYIEDLSKGDLKIYLAVLAYNHDDTTADNGGRFLTISGGMTNDEFSEGAPVAIPRLRPNLQLLAGSEPADRYVSMPLATITREKEGLKLGDFVPPSLCVPSGSALRSMCSDLNELLRRKTAFLSVQQVALATSSSLADRIAALEAGAKLQGVVAGLPLFEAVLGTQSVHPYALYLALCNLLGPIALLSTKLDPPSPTAYRHDDLRQTFAALMQNLKGMLDTISETYVEKKFIEKDGRFTLLIDKACVPGQLTIGVRGRSERDLTTWLNGSLIGSQSVVDSLQTRRITGARRGRVQQFKYGPPPSAGITLFEIDAARDAGFVLPDQPLVIYNPSSGAEQLRPAEILLYIDTPAATAQPAAAPRA